MYILWLHLRPNKKFRTGPGNPYLKQVPEVILTRGKYRVCPK